MDMTEEYWTKIAVNTSPEAVEAVAGILMEAGAGGIEIDDPNIWQESVGTNCYGELYPEIRPISPNAPVKVIAYLAGDCRMVEVIATIKKRVLALKNVGLDASPGTISTELLAESDWAHSWKEFYHTQRVGEHLVIKPTWESYIPQPGDMVLELDPGMAFGTGEHETTRLCLEQLGKRIHPGSIVYDIGTGSGILALAAAKLGAAKVIACDLDPVAVSVARGNIAHSGLDEKISVQEGSIDAIPGQANLIIANIIADVILEILPTVVDRLVKGGYFLAGGITRERRDEVVDALKASDLTLVAEAKEGDWVSLVSKR